MCVDVNVVLRAQAARVAIGVYAFVQTLLSETEDDARAAWSLLTSREAIEKRMKPRVVDSHGRGPGAQSSP